MQAKKDSSRTERLVSEAEKEKRELQETARKVRQTDQSDFLLNRNNLLKEYYQKAFPALALCRWLGYNTELGMSSTSKTLYRREVSFQVETQSGDECVIRFLTYSTAQALLTDMIEKVPKRLDFGAMYGVPPTRQNQEAGALQPMEREYVIDIDMSDYDDIRTCCSGKKVCQKCWKFLAIAQKVLSRSLKCDFGFRHILWVFSGRRGIHAWVCDKRARVMDSAVRQHISQHLDLTVSGKKSNRLIKPQLRTDLKSNIAHEFTSRTMKETFELVDRYFLPVLVREQNFFAKNENVQWMFEVLGSIAAELAQHESDPYCHMDKHLVSVLGTPGSEARWDKIRQIFCERAAKAHQQKVWSMFQRELTVGLLYPKLDLHVSAQMNHLLKIPFNVHQDTGCISIPLRGSAVEHFDLDAAPLITSVLEKGGELLLQPYVQLLEGFVRKVAADGYEDHA